MPHLPFMQAVVTIQRFRPEFTESISALIVGIQHDEFGVAITADEQPDLRAIPEFYQLNAGNFWVATSDDRVVGTIALKDLGNHDAALRKMFVAPDARGKASGVANALLETLLQWAREQGIRRIYLGTTDAFRAAHRFYEKNGFQVIQPE
ncbi:MAG TPA: GNAT family N-acetyltransferase, partial [Candidatus Koribacter sp.]